MRDILVLDIETAPNPAMLEYVEGPADVSVLSPPKNYKKQEIIDSWYEKQEVEQEQKYQERLTKMSLDVDYARITALGMYLGLMAEGSPVTVHTPKTEDEERETLRDFWNLAYSANKFGLPYPGFYLCGYNIRCFDLPIILRRSWQLGVEPTMRIDFRKYGNDDILDLMDIFYGNGDFPGPKARSLKAVAKMYGIDNPLPDLDGSMSADMDEATLAAYCANDVRMTFELARRTKGFYWR